MRQHPKKGFTLVELIVVITILAILGTIAFISFQGYSKESRNSVRIADISNIETTFELFGIESGFYPEPTNGVDVTYSGATVWNQGTVGESVIQTVQNLSNIPLDPSTETEYVYSRISEKNEYEILAQIEGSLSHSPSSSQVYAEGEDKESYISGTYNGLMAKAIKGQQNYILALPNIVAYDTSTTELREIENMGGDNLAINGERKGKKSFEPLSEMKSGSGTRVVIWDDSSFPSGASVPQLMKNAQSAYSGTILGERKRIKTMLEASEDDLASIGKKYVNKMGGKIEKVASYKLVKDINPGSGAGAFGPFIELDGKVYFRGNDGVNGYELWSYDGVNEPTLAHEIQPGVNSGMGTMGMLYKGKIYFRGNDGSTGQELWSFDGINPPTLVHDLNTGTGDGLLTIYTIFKGKLYFTGDDGSTGEELWSYDGVNPPTLVDDYYPGILGSHPRELYTFGEKLLYRVTTGMVEYDGVNTPTPIPSEHPTGPMNPSNYVELNGKVYFRAEADTNEYELFEYDGENMAKVLEPDSSTNSSGVFGLVKYKNKIYFNASDGVNGAELWSYDGVNLKQEYEAYSGPDGSHPSSLYVYDKKLYFSANNELGTGNLYSYNGRKGSLVIPSTGSHYISDFIVFSGYLHFRGYNGEGKYQVFRLEGNEAKQITTNSNTGGGSAKYFRNMTIFNDKLIISTKYESNGRELVEISYQ